jgi:signal transduction histidine kinase
MFQSLRARLALLFAGTLLLATVISLLASVRLYQSYARGQTADELKGQVSGIASYYEKALEEIFGGKGVTSRVGAQRFEQITGSELYYSGTEPFPGQPQTFRQAGINLDWRVLKDGERRVFEFTPAGESHRYVGVATPIVLEGQPIGAIVLAKPLADINNAWTAVAARVAGGVGLGLLAAFALATFFSRRITRPLRRLGDAADRVAHGDLDVNVVDAATADDELGVLAARFQDMVDRLREVDELERNFLMRVSHELRTPITAISGHVQALTEGLVEPEYLDESLGAVNEEVSRLDRLVGDLLDLARLEAHRFSLVREEVALETLLDRAVAAFRDKARLNELDFDPRTENAPTVLTDGDRVLQIVTNLLDNAFRWTPRGGRVTLEWSVAGSMVSVTVTDTGPGIAPSDHEAVFHPFYSRRGEGGTGLGLSIARELAHALGGRLWVESEPGKGATFILTLPLAPSRPARDSHAAAGGAPVGARHRAG